MRVTPAYLSSITTFYDMFNTEPVGRHYIYACTSVACNLVGAQQVYRALEAGEEIPAVALGGAQALDPARSQLVQLDLEPGDYVIWCQIPSPDGQPHVMKGMIAQVTVEAA